MLEAVERFIINISRFFDKTILVIVIRQAAHVLYKQTVKKHF